MENRRSPFFGRGRVTPAGRPVPPLRQTPPPTPYYPSAETSAPQRAAPASQAVNTHVYSGQAGSPAYGKAPRPINTTPPGQNAAARKTASGRLLRLSKNHKTAKKMPLTADIKQLSARQYLRLSVKYAGLARKVFVRKHPWLSRGLALFMALLLLLGIYIQMHDAKTITETPKQLRSAQFLLSPAVPSYAKKITAQKDGGFSFNKDYVPVTDATGDTSTPKISAQFSGAPKNEISVKDEQNSVTFSMAPLFDVQAPRQESSRIVYPLLNNTGAAVYSMKGIGIKEDLVLYSYTTDQVEFSYKLTVSEGTEARIDPDGSLGVYGADPALLGNVTTSSDKDAELLKKARNNSSKTHLLFRIPAPIVLEGYKKKSTKAEASFTLNNNQLKVTAHGLKNARFPLSIDPSIYVETAAKLMRGNNESNIDFDTTNELIQKSQTTGARIDSWSTTNAPQSSMWNGGTVAAGGYIYRIGGTEFYRKVFKTSGTSTFVVPTGVTTLNAELWGAGGGGGAGGSGTGIGGKGGGGAHVVAAHTVTPGETITIQVGGGGAAGAYVSGNEGGGGGGGAYSTVSHLVSGVSTALDTAAGGGGGGGGRANSNGSQGGAGGDTTSGAGGTASGVANGGGGATSSAGGSAGTGGTSSGAAGGSLTGGAGGITTGGVSGGTPGGGAGGAYSSNRSGGGGGGSGLFGGGGGSGSASNTGGGGGGGGSSYTATGTATAGSNDTPGDSTDVDRNASAGTGGASGAATASGGAGADGIVVLTYTVSGLSTTNSAKLYWSKFDSSTGQVSGSVDPGNGTICYNWCTNSSYDLYDTGAAAAAPRRAFSLVAYNGYLYVMGGLDSAGSRTSTVFIAKLGANGEPQLWSPTYNGTPSFWYKDSGLNGGTARSYFGAYAYNNKMYVLGGQTNATPNGVTTVEAADITPMGTLSTWTTTGMQALSSSGGLYEFTVLGYNGTLYVVGGFNGVNTATASLKNTVYYSKLNSDGTMNAWNLAISSGFSSPRATFGGTMATIWGAYIYVSGGCSAVNATTGYCTTVPSDVQLASINADGTLSEWGSILGLANQRFGGDLLTWQGGLYRMGGCNNQNASTGVCDFAMDYVDYGVINPEGDASTVATSVASGSSPCSGTTPTNCNLPGSSFIGNLLNATAIVNGYLYVIGGCTSNNCNSTSANVAYLSIASDGSLQKPATCPAGTYQGGSYCVDATNTISGGIEASGVAVFGNRIYVVGGSNGASNKGNIYDNSVNNDGSLAGAWRTTSMATIGATSVSFSYAYARANPASVGTNPANLYIFGGCTTVSSNDCTAYTDAVYKCNIDTTGAPSGCSTSGQLQIGTVSGASGAGMGTHSGTVYANYVYLIGGQAPSVAQLATVRYAKIDNSNNVVAASGSAWTVSSNQTAVGRRRGAAFGYNGYIYVVGGYEATTGVLADIEFAKIDVSTGDISSFDVSSVTINQRWGLSVPVSNSYAYVIGGCTVGAAPANCSTRTDVIQTFQIFNNNSGAVLGYTAGNVPGGGVDSIGGSSTIMNGYIYYTRGCSALTCTPTTTTYYAAIDAYGVVGTWSTGGNLPTATAWGRLVNAGGTLYYVGGQTGSATTTAVGTIFYSSSISSGNPTWATATKGIGDTGSGAQARTQLGVAVWDDTIFVTGGFNASGTAQSTVYVSPYLGTGGDITSSWPAATTSFNVARGGHTTIAYANNLYVLGGFDGTNYLQDVQFSQINLDTNTKHPNGTIGGWSYTTNLTSAIRDADGYAANGYMYLVGGRTATTTCAPNTIVAPISANTTIASGNNPKGVGEWFETNSNYTGDRYGAAVSYNAGKAYVIGGGCSSFVASGDRMYYTTLKSQPIIAIYSRMIDTDTDVFPTKWLMNGLDNSTGARWYLRYRSMHDIDALQNPNEDCGTSATMPVMTTWGQETNFGAVTLGSPQTYTALNSSGGNINCARYFYFYITIDSSRAFGYPEDVTRGPTIADLSLFFTSDPSKRMRHGKTFTGGQQQPLDTPF